MNGPTAAVVIFFLLMCVKRLLLSQTPSLRYDTHTHKMVRSTVCMNRFPEFSRSAFASSHAFSKFSLHHGTRDTPGALSGAISSPLEARPVVNVSHS